MLRDETPKRLIPYIRVSTEEQADSGAGLAAQRTALERWFAYKEIEPLELVADEGASGKDLHRPGLRQALDLIAAGDADGLVVAKLDRLSRSVVDFGDLMEWFTAAGAALIALDFELDTNSAGGHLVANIFMAVAEWERRTIGERTRNAMAAKRAAGQATGRPAVFQQAEVLARIQQLQSEGKGNTEIARQLNEEGWPTVRGGLKWRASSVATATGYRRPPQRRRRAELPPLPRRRHAPR